jgi:hypothetical protein
MRQATDDLGRGNLRAWVCLTRRVVLDHSRTAKRHVLRADESCVVTEKKCRGTHLRTFLGWPATGKPVLMSAIVVGAFQGRRIVG